MWVILEELKYFVTSNCFFEWGGYFRLPNNSVNAVNSLERVRKLYQLI